MSPIVCTPIGCHAAAHSPPIGSLSSWRLSQAADCRPPASRSKIAHRRAALDGNTERPNWTASPPESEPPAHAGR